MLNTLYAKLIAVLVGLTIVMAVMFLTVIRNSDVARNQEINQKLYRNLASRLISERIFEEDRANPAVVQNVFDRIRLVNPRVDVYLLDSSGHVIASSGLNALQRKVIDLEPIRRFLDEKIELPILGDDPSDASRPRVFSAAPISLAGADDGYLYIVFRSFSSDTLAQRIKQSYVLRETLWLVGTGLLAALFAGALIIMLITRPLRNLTTVVDKFRGSGFAEHPEPLRSPRDDIGKLTETFNGMADRILEQMNELKQTDALRRELVANISHDLRTPIATLQGYLETLHLKGSSLSGDEQRNYLEIALKQTEQLSALVARLFDLAKLDSGQIELNAEPFALGDLIQDVAQDFALAAANKSVTVRCSTRSDLPLVLADIALIERVLRNLIDNGLRHTPKGGSVAVTAYGGAEGALLEVADTGSGIPAEELPRIFDRFHRVEKNRGLEDGNAGLGLAITKGILDLHGSAITVTSVPGRTVFRFTLRYADPPVVHVPAESDKAAAPPRTVPTFSYPMPRLEADG
jgi:two-component system OmpR family sensor kinase